MILEMDVVTTLTILDRELVSAISRKHGELIVDDAFKMLKDEGHKIIGYNAWHNIEKMAEVLCIKSSVLERWN